MQAEDIIRITKGTAKVMGEQKEHFDWDTKLLTPAQIRKQQVKQIFQRLMITSANAMILIMMAHLLTYFGLLTNDAFGIIAIILLSWIYSGQAK